MNIETVHSIGLAVVHDLSESGIQTALTELQRRLTNAVGNPRDPTPAMQVTEAREAFRAACESSQVADFPPVWLEYLDEMGVSDLLGDKLLTRIDESFRDNQVSLSAVQADVALQRERIDSMATAFEQLTASLAFLKIGTDDLRPGDVELGFLIPRIQVRNELGLLGREFAQLKKIVGPFQEVATGSRDALVVRAISSSNFGVLLDIDPETARLMARSIGFLIDKYRQVLEIRKLRAEIERLQMPEQLATNVDEFAGAQITAAIDELTESIMTEYLGTVPRDGRAHELRADLNLALTGVSQRIDVGYSIQIRSSAPELPEADPDGDERPELEENDERLMALHQEIEELRESLSFLRPDGAPILTELSAGDLGIPDDADDSDAST